MFRQPLLRILLLLFSISLWGQSSLIEYDLINKVDEIPADLRKTRSVVILSMNEDGTNWQKQAINVHNQLKGMKIDAVSYIHYWNYNASPVVKSGFQKFLRDRAINYMILVRATDDVQVAIIPMKNGLPDYSSGSWYTRDKSVQEAFFKLALLLKRQDDFGSNFLISDYPEVIDDIPIFSGGQYPTYPGQLQRMALGVVLLPEIKVNAANENAQNIIEVHNNEIRAKNELIKKVFEDDYPYPFEFLEYGTDEEIADKRFQYALRFVHTSGETAKKLLNYKIEQTETDFISMVPANDGQRTLKTFSIDKRVYKFYIQQTIVYDCHVGRYWDADETLEGSLRNFIGNMQNQFERTN